MMKLLVYVQVYKGSWNGKQIKTLGTNKNMLLWMRLHYYMYCTSCVAPDGDWSI
jgi:hypothetical protein